MDLEAGGRCPIYGVLSIYVRFETLKESDAA
jgi:hypothetical protein